MTEADKLVWYEADGTRHIYGEPPRTEDPGTAAEEPEAETHPASPVPDREATDPVGSVAADTEREEPVVEDEPSAMGGMMRSLLLGAAAAAATGVIVGAISLTATGSRPATFEDGPASATVDEASTDGQLPATSGEETAEIDRVDLIPPMTSGDQPG